MENILYFDINSGISGDMTIGALLDLGVDQEKFREELAKLNLDEYNLEITSQKKNGITGTDFKVILNENGCNCKDNNDSDKKHNCCNDNSRHHDHSHNHNHDHENNHSHFHDHEHHDHEDSHSHGHSHNRNFNDIKKLINDSSLSDSIKELSINIFEKVARAEAKVHDKDIGEVHFHEVGAVDSIVDIVGTAILIEILNPDHIYSSKIPLGTGFVNADHGNIPVPAPATIEILKDVPVYSNGIKSELVTPTGAAIIKTLAEAYMPLPELNINKIGYGTGKKDLEITNVLRVYQAKKKE
ncbi:MAG: LarC family nickel insertion protein [Bacillota bacterium]